MDLCGIRPGSRGRVRSTVAVLLYSLAASARDVRPNIADVLDALRS